MVQLSHPYMTTGKTTALTIRTFVGKVMSLLFNTLFRFVIAFLSRSKRLLISWLQSLSANHWLQWFGAQENKIFLCFHLFSPSICHEVKGLDAMILVFWKLSFKPVFSLSSFILIKRLFNSFHEWYHLHIWGCWYFSRQSWFQIRIPPNWPFVWCTLWTS